VCYRLYGKHDLPGMLPFTQPEIPGYPVFPNSARTRTGLGLLRDLSASIHRVRHSTGRSGGLPFIPGFCLMVRAQELAVNLGADLPPPYRAGYFRFAADRILPGKRIRKELLCAGGAWEKNRREH
jgi:hypothetical protein